MATPDESLLKDWHRLFGLYWIDFFTHWPFAVEIEKDLSVKKQLLDVIILRRGRGGLPGRLPDGFEDLAAHTLITFKSFREALDDWALKELTGHYVNYRKLVSPSWHNLLAEEEFRLYAVCSRFPHNLANTIDLQAIQQGVYECRRGTDRIRVIVLRQLPQTENNAMLHLFSGSQELISYGAEHYQQRSHETSRLLANVLLRYEQEGVAMSYTMENFRRDSTKKLLNMLTPREVLNNLSAENRRELLKDLLVEEHLEGKSAEEIQDFLTRGGKAAPKRKRPRSK